MLPVVAAHPDAAHVGRPAASEALDDVPGPVAAAILDQDDLVVGDRAPRASPSRRWSSGRTAAERYTGTTAEMPGVVGGVVIAG